MSNKNEEIPDHIKRYLEDLFFEFGQRLTRERMQAGIKHKYELGLKLGWSLSKSKSYIPLLEKGEKLVKLPILMEIASIFGYKLELNWVDIRKPQEQTKTSWPANENGNGLQKNENGKLESIASEPLMNNEYEHPPPG